MAERKVQCLQASPPSLAAGGEAVVKDCYENIDSRCASPVHSAIFMEGGEAPLHDR